MTAEIIPIMRRSFFLFYEGDDPEGFANELVEKYNFDPRGDPGWTHDVNGEPWDAHFFYCPEHLYDTIRRDYEVGT